MKLIHKKIKQQRVDFIRRFSKDMKTTKDNKMFSTIERNHQAKMMFHRHIMEINGPTYLVGHLKNIIQQAKDTMLLKGFWHLKRTHPNLLEAGNGGFFQNKQALIKLFSKELGIFKQEDSVTKSLRF